MNGYLKIDRSLLTIFFALSPIFVSATSVDCSVAFVKGAFSDLEGRTYNWPFGEDLFYVPAADVVPGPPLLEDYAARIQNGDRYQILKDVPRTDSSKYKDLMQHGSERSIQFNSGIWTFTDSNQALPSSIQTRLQSLHRKALDILGPNIQFIGADLRYANLPHDAKRFHPDSGWPDYVLLDSWDGEKTYIQGKNGNIFQTEENEAVLLKANVGGWLHAFPANENLLKTRRYFLRLKYL